MAKWSDLVLELATALHHGLQYQAGDHSETTHEALAEALLEVHGILDPLIREDVWFEDLPKG